MYVCRHDTFLPSSPQISNSNSPALPPNRYVWAFLQLNVFYQQLNQICQLWLRLKTPVQLFRKTVRDSLCLISSSVSEQMLSIQAAVFSLEARMRAAFLQRYRGLYKSLNDCCQCQDGQTSVAFLSRGCLPVQALGWQLRRRIKESELLLRGGSVRRCSVLYSLQERETAPLCSVPYLPCAFVFNILNCLSFIISQH